jgi:hypothetical protein
LAQQIESRGVTCLGLAGAMRQGGKLMVNELIAQAQGHVG